MKNLSKLFSTKSALRRCLELSSIDLLSNSQAGVWIISLDGITEYVNPSLSRMLGYSFDEMIDHPITEFFEPEARELMKSHISKRARGISESYNFRVLKRDGLLINIAIAANPILDTDQKPVGAMAFIIEFQIPSLQMISSHYESHSAIPTIESSSEFEQVISCNNLELYPRMIEYSINGKRYNISAFTFKLLVYFVENKNRVISRSELIEHVWQSKEINERVIDGHILDLRKKLSNFNGILKTVYGMGYLLSTVTNKKTR